MATTVFDWVRGKTENHQLVHHFALICTSECVDFCTFITTSQLFHSFTICDHQSWSPHKCCHFAKSRKMLCESSQTAGKPKELHNFKTGVGLMSQWFSACWHCNFKFQMGWCTQPHARELGRKQNEKRWQMTEFGCHCDLIMPHDLGLMLLHQTWRSVGRSVTMSLRCQTFVGLCCVMMNEMSKNWCTRNWKMMKNAMQNERRQKHSCQRRIQWNKCWKGIGECSWCFQKQVTETWIWIETKGIRSSDNDNNNNNSHRLGCYLLYGFKSSIRPIGMLSHVGWPESRHTQEGMQCVTNKGEL